ncbi:MAG: hypothetical protein CSA35_01410 [Dethiosulfovibrio peptidovorans]|nr:MAG: hypothetical protein CSA35_01410 [Dethiosulfovibrio peptidovorans]
MSTFQAAVAYSTRRIAARLTPGSDLFQGIRDICERYDITCASIDLLLGSLRSATVTCITSDPNSPSGTVYRPPLTVSGPLELIGAWGTIGVEDNAIAVHLHGLVALDEHSPICGHFVDSGENLVLATAEIQLTELMGMEWLREIDSETGFPLFKPQQGDPQP